MEYNGIREEAIWLLAENRFQNSKAFYEEHKKEINEGVVFPLRRLIEDLRPVLEEINPDLILDPMRCLSRVRRDTRFTNDKTLYRENLWMMFRHQKNELPTPMLWFEIFPDGYNYGCGIISATPSFLEYWRSELRRDPAPVVEGAKRALAAGLTMDTEVYKRSKAAADGVTDPEVIPWYDAKALFVSRHTDGIGRLNKPRALVQELKKSMREMGDLYRAMLDVTIRFNTRGCEDEND